MYRWIDPINFGRILPEWPNKDKKDIIRLPQRGDGMTIEFPGEMPKVEFPELEEIFKTREVPAEMPLQITFPEFEPNKADVVEITMPFHLDPDRVKVKTAEGDDHGNTPHSHIYLDIMG